MPPQTLGGWATIGVHMHASPEPHRVFAQ